VRPIHRPFRRSASVRAMIAVERVASHCICHFGHIGSWEILDALMQPDGWLGVLPPRATGARKPAGGAFRLMSRRSSINSSPAASSASIPESAARLRSVLLAACMGASDARPARNGSASGDVFTRAVRAWRDPRSALERDSGTADRKRAGSTTICECSGERRFWSHQNVRIFGTVRYMSSESTVRKMPVKEYVRRYPPNRHTEPRLDR
jgi:hypothetical protein